LAESEDKRKKKKTRLQKIKSTISSTMYLLRSLFENFGCIAKLHEEIVNENTEKYSLRPRNYLFNGQEECDYLFGQGIINEASINDKAYLVLYESWCLFMKREFYKNLLSILNEVNLRTYGEIQTITQNRFCKLFDLHDDEKIQAYLMKIRNTTHSDFGLSYQTVLNNQTYTIRSGNVRPCQFVLGNIPTISGITDNVGRGWNDKKWLVFLMRKTRLDMDNKKFP
jgi:hypothetical protein